MALATGTAWELRTAGSDTNGGGFVSGSGGTDYSQQNAANSGGSNGSTTDAVANGTTTITSATAAFTTAINNNVIYLAGGSGSLAGGPYQATYVSATSITVDRTVASGTGITMNIGGALASFGRLNALMVAGNKAFVKNDGTYTSTANLTWSAGNSPNASNPITEIIGYTSTRGDNGQAPLTFSTVTTSYGMILGAAVTLRNLGITCNGNSHGGINLATAYARAINCKVSGSGASVYGINGDNSVICSIVGCEVTGMLASTSGGIGAGKGCTAFNNTVHDGVGPGIKNNGGVSFHNVIYGLTGASAGDGILVSDQFSPVINNTIYNCARHGIYASTSKQFFAQNNILSQNGGYGMASLSAIAADPATDGNAYYSNTSGATNNLSDTSTAPNGTNPYTNVNDVTLSADPFVAKASADFRLNSTAGGGAACRNAGVPKSTPGLVAPISQPFPDFGALQHNDAGGSTTYVINQNINRILLNEGDY